MAWTTPQFIRADVNRAGKALVDLQKDNPEREKAVAVVDNWRACHAYPLQIIKMTLWNRAKKIDENALIAQRLKRRPSIEVKLQQNSHMQLSQMQDIGGCRAVMRNVSDARKLVKIYKKSHSKSPKDRSKWDGSDNFDYINNPKPDGYRSVHLIFKFQSPSPDRMMFNGQRIEIQIRSKLQHLWATAVETAQVFTGQALKTKIKRASDDWLRFFALTSSAFARREKCQIVPRTPENKRALIRELRAITKRENIMEVLGAWSNTIHELETHIEPGAHSFLLKLDPIRKSLTFTSFRKEEITLAQDTYNRVEKETEDDPNIQVVLVSVVSVATLRKAYPNYYADTKDFLIEVRKEIGTKKTMTKPHNP